MAIRRPGPGGEHRSACVGFEGGNRVLINARWRCDDGLVHQASKHNNRTLCEMGATRFTTQLHLGSMTYTVDRVTCVRCMGYVTWRDYPID